MRWAGRAVWLLYFAYSLQSASRCRAHEQRCEMFCQEDHPGGSLARMRCFERCRAKELACNRDGDDEP